MDDYTYQSSGGMTLYSIIIMYVSSICCTEIELLGAASLLQVPMYINT